jgi:hypothetical protein
MPLLLETRRHRKENGLCIQCNSPVSSGVNCDLCKTKAITQMNKYRRSNRLKVINYYGGRCVRCHESIIQFLTIDHINGGGGKHKKILNGSIDPWLIKNNYPDNFQILCYNCNFFKYYMSLEHIDNRAHRCTRKLRGTIISAYGSQCVCCGITEKIVLTIDHKFGNGRQHRLELGGGQYGSENLYRWLRNHNYPEDFQLLCYNCNCGRSINGGVCPHITFAREDKR